MMAGFGKKRAAGQAGFGKKSTHQSRAYTPHTATPASLDFLTGGAGAAAQAQPDYMTIKTGSAGQHAGKPVGLRRVVSFLIDTLVVSVPFFVVMSPQLIAALEASANATPDSQAEAKAQIDMYTLILMHAVVRCAYAVAMEASALQATLGKMALGLVVTNKHFEKPSLLSVIMRNTLGRFVVNVIPFYIGYIIAFFGEKKGVHDMMSGTRVCKKAPAEYTANPSEIFA